MRRVVRSGKWATFLIGILLVVIGRTGQSDAGVNVTVGVFAPPPAYVVPAPAPMAAIPGSYVYVAPALMWTFCFITDTGGVPMKGGGTGRGITMGRGDICPARGSLAL